MEINPYESRLRMLQQVDGVQMQREAAPDDETAGCPGCPFFWTCPVPHRGEEVRTPQQVELADVRDQLATRRRYRPRDESDVGFSDVWVDENGERLEDDELDHLDDGADAELAEAADEDLDDPVPAEVPGDPDGSAAAADVPAPSPRGAGRRRRSGPGLLRRLGRRG